MKKFILAAVAASLVATPALAAPFQNYGPNDRGSNDRGRIEQSHRPDVRRPDIRRPDIRHDDFRPGKPMQVRQNWKRGDRFDARRAYNYRVVNNPRYYHLNDAPRGYRWVQSGQDAVLVGIASGIIASVMAGALR